MTEQLRYRIFNTATPEIVDLLSSTVYGSSGLRYTHLDAEQKIHDLTTPDFHTLWNGNELIAVAAYCKRKVKCSSTLYDAYYIRYFSVKPAHQGKGIGKLLTGKLESHYREKLTKETVFYAYIEKRNLQSIGVSNHFKQESIGAFKPVLFSRFFPKVAAGFEQISTTEYEAFVSDQYSEHALFHTNKVGYKGQCYGIRNNGHLKVAIQANPVGWKLHNIPGMLGWLGRNIFHYLPILGRLSPRNKFHYLAFEGLCVKDQHLVSPLLESCLATFNRHVGMLYLDLTDPFFLFFEAEKGMGLMQKLQHPPSVSILCNFVNFDEKKKSNFHDFPKYISCFDLT